MFKPYNMSKVIITGQNNLQESVINELHKLKILHIVEHSKNELADIGEPLNNANTISEILVKVRALIVALNIKKEEHEFDFSEYIEGRSDLYRKNEEGEFVQILAYGYQCKKCGKVTYLGLEKDAYENLPGRMKHCKDE